MEKGPIDFKTVVFDDEDIGGIFGERLSYAKARAEAKQPLPDMEPNVVPYAKTILLALRVGLGPRLHERITQIRAKFDAEMRRLGVVSGPNGQDDSWIWWDLAKQLFFFLSKDRTGTSVRYRIANPLVDDEICDEIVSRMVGFELYWAPGYSFRSEADFLLGPDGRSSKKPDQRASWALTALGELARFGRRPEVGPSRGADPSQGSARPAIAT
jgi:hypothetical protein